MNSQAPSLPDRTRSHLIATARRLAWLSLAWITVEGLVATIAGVAAGSVALTGFGLDSAIEGAASAIVIWRFTRNRALSETAEHRAQKAIAVSFFLLALYLAIDATYTLATDLPPQTSWIGIAASSASLIVMPTLAAAKRGLARPLDSGALASEAVQNMLCAYLAAGVLASLLANTVLGMWQLDPLIALGITVLAVHEGREAWEATTARCASPPPS